MRGGQGREAKEGKKGKKEEKEEKEEKERLAGSPFHRVVSWFYSVHMRDKRKGGEVTAERRRNSVAGCATSFFFLFLLQRTQKEQLLATVKNWV